MRFKTLNIECWLKIARAKPVIFLKFETNFSRRRTFMMKLSSRGNSDFNRKSFATSARNVL